MIKSSSQSYCDVKTFLNKDKSSKSFVSYTVGRRAQGGAKVFVISAIMLSLLFVILFDSFEETVIRGVVRAHSFSEDKAKGALSTENILLSMVSPILVEKQDKKRESYTVALPPKPDITVKKAPSNGIDIKNETPYTVDTASILNEKVVLDTKSPKVLIVHTHGSESYTSSTAYNYNTSANYRTQDTRFNMIKVGDEIAKHLKKKGIEVIHDRTINDYPSYNDSYNKTAAVIEKHLKADKDIVFVFDIHRDAVGEGDNIVKFVSDIKGKSAAQVMMVCGSDVNLENPDWRENLKLAIHIQNSFEDKYPGFLRPLNLRKERFNMHLTSGSLLFEVGTNGNTLDEALVAAKFLGEGLGDIINSLKEQ